MGKMKAVDGVKNLYVLHDSGQSFVNPGFDIRNLRREYGSFQFRYEPCNIGNIRQLTAIFPIVERYQYQGTSQDQQHLDIYTTKEHRPLNYTESLLQCYLNDKALNIKSNKSSKYRVFESNRPQWHPKQNSYTYDFKGRVTVPSVKNLQVLPKLEDSTEQTLGKFIL